MVGGTVKSVDDSAALAVPGVEKVVQLEGHMPPAKFLPLGGVAVIASNTYAALKGRDALVIEWDDGPHAVYDSVAYRAEMEATAQQPGKAIRTQGDVDAAFSSAAKTFGQHYYQAHMAHIPMEPPAALASFADGKLEIWAPVQSPYGTRQDVAEFTGVPIEDVKVNVTLLGGGFGRKSKCDFVHEAAKLSMEVGAPVRVQWTREDDIRHSFYHTTSVERIEVSLDADNKPTGWLHRSVAPSILSTFAEDSGYQFFIEYGMGFADMPFEIPNIRARTARRWPIRGSAGSVRFPMCRARLPSSLLLRSLPMNWDATRRRSCSSSSARPGSSIPRKPACRRIFGTTAILMTSSRTIPAAWPMSSSLHARRLAGARSCRTARGLVSPFTGAF